MYRHAAWRLRKDLCESVRQRRVSGDPGRDFRFSWLRNLINQEDLSGCHWASIAVMNPYALVHGLSGSRMMKLSYDCTA